MKNNTHPLIIGIGELLWDMLPSGKKAGGAPVNVVYHATQLGAQGYAISAVGNDVLGNELLETMKKSGINYITPQVDHPTGTVNVTLKNGTPTYDIVKNVAWDFIPITDEIIELTSKADAIAYGTLAQRNCISHQTICQLLKAAPKDSLRYYDINLRQNYYSKEIIDKLLQLSNILKINDEELEVIKPLFGLESKNNEEIAHWFMNRYDLIYFILTAGADYSSIYSNKEISTIKTQKVVVSDTIGAGDSFSGAFLYSILTGASLKEAHKKAIEVSAFVCTKKGAWPKYNF